VIRTERQDLENQQVERALQQVRLWHGLLSEYERSLRIVPSEVKRSAAEIIREREPADVCLPSFSDFAGAMALEMELESERC
jgi:hypothetical protein